MKKIKAFYEKHKETILYFYYGILTTIACFGSFALCYYVGLKPFIASKLVCAQISNVVSWIVAAIFAYVVNKVLVFKTRGRTFWEVVKEFSVFLACRIASLGMEIGWTMIFVGAFHINAMINKIVISILVVLVNYLLSKWLIFRNKEEKKNELDVDRDSFV